MKIYEVTRSDNDKFRGVIIFTDGHFGNAGMKDATNVTNDELVEHARKNIYSLRLFGLNQKKYLDTFLISGYEVVRVQ